MALGIAIAAGAAHELPLNRPPSWANTALTPGFADVCNPRTVETGKAVEDFAERLAAFHEHYNVFVREYLGCPKGAQRVEQCDRALGRFDLAEFKRAARAARRLFPD